MDKDDRKRELTIEAEAASQLSILQRGGAELPELFTREILLMETMVNGAMHVENIHELAAELHPGDPVKLVLEPDNPHDPRAILVRDQHDRKLGYSAQALYSYAVEFEFSEPEFAYLNGKVYKVPDKCVKFMELFRK